MSCTRKRFFGIDLVDEEANELSPEWAGPRTRPGVLVFVGRRILWRLVRSKSLRTFFHSGGHVVAPVERGVTRQIALATGCQVGPFQEFQALVRLLSRGEESSAAVYILGRTAPELQRVEQNVRDTFPGIRVVGRAVFHPVSIASVTTAIRKAAPRIVLSGVVSPTFFRWVITETDRIGPVLTVVAPRALGRMAGRSRRFGIYDVVTIPLRLFLPIVLLVHRLRAVRRQKKSQG